MKGLNWSAGAVGNATWSGVKLRDVLKLAEINEDSDYDHVQVSHKLRLISSLRHTIYLTKHL